MNDFMLTFLQNCYDLDIPLNNNQQRLIANRLVNQHRPDAEELHELNSEISFLFDDYYKIIQDEISKIITCIKN